MKRRLTLFLRRCDQDGILADIYLSTALLALASGLAFGLYLNTLTH